MNKAKLFVALVVALGLAAWPGMGLTQPAQEAPGVTPPEEAGTWLSRGPLKVRGYLETAIQARSNIFLAEVDEKSDLIFMVKPGVAVRHDLSETSFWSVEYQGTYAWYRDFTGNDWTSHFIPFNARIGGKKGAFLELSNDFLRSSDPFGSENLYNLGVTTQRTQNIAYLAPGWTFSDKSWGKLYARYTILEYDLYDDRFQNQREWNYGGIWYYKFLPKTSFLIQYTYVTRDYTDQPEDVGEDFKRHDAYVGLAWDGTSKLSGELKLGWSSMDYDNTLNAAGQRYQAKDTWIAEILLTWSATPRLSLSFSMFRGIKQSTQGFDVTPVGTGFENNYYIDTSATLGARYAILDNLSAYTNVGYGLQDYNQLVSFLAAREDKVAQVEVGLEYDFLKYLYLKGYYLYNYRDSNQALKGYTDNVYYVGLGGRF
jgi:putative beta-barrel porin BBP2